MSHSHIEFWHAQSAISELNLRVSVGVSETVHRSTFVTAFFCPNCGHIWGHRGHICPTKECHNVVHTPKILPCYSCGDGSMFDEEWNYGEVSMLYNPRRVLLWELMHCQRQDQS